MASGVWTSERRHDALFKRAVRVVSGFSGPFLTVARFPQDSHSFPYVQSVRVRCNCVKNLDSRCSVCNSSPHHWSAIKSKRSGRFIHTSLGGEDSGRPNKLKHRILDWSNEWTMDCILTLYVLCTLQTLSYSSLRHRFGVNHQNYGIVSVRTQTLPQILQKSFGASLSVQLPKLRSTDAQRFTAIQLVHQSQSAASRWVWVLRNVWRCPVV